MSVWQKFLRRLPPVAPITRRPFRSRPGLEMLEERCVPATIYVNVNGGSDSNPGTLAAPFASIQAAVNLAKEYALGEIAPQTNNNTIEVAVGTYTNAGSGGEASSLGFPAVVGIADQSVLLEGGFNAAFTAVTGQSVIDGGSAIRDVALVSSAFVGAPATGITMSNFTIQNGLGTPSTIAGNLDGFGGGMIINLGGTPTGNGTDTLNNVTFTNNIAQSTASTSAGTNGGSGGDSGGGGLAAFFANNVTLNNVTFTGNVSRGGNGVVKGGSGLGGAIYASNASQINGNSDTFTNNTAVGGMSSGTGVSGSQFAEGFGGAVGLFTQGTSATFTGTTATGNIAQGGTAGNAAGDDAGDARGGAFYSENATLSITNSTLSGNTAQGGVGSDGGEATVGGAIYTTAFTNAVTITLSQDTIINNTVNGPTVTGAATQVLGGGIGADNANGEALTVNATNTVIAGNSVNSATTPLINSGGGAVWSNGVTINLSQCTLADNVIGASNMTASSILEFVGTTNVANSIIANETGTQPAVAGFSGGAVNLTGPDLFANVANAGLPAEANLLTAASADFTNSSARNYTLLPGSPAIMSPTNLGVVQFTTPPNSPPPAPPPPPPAIPGTHPVSELGAYRSSDGSWSLQSDPTSQTFTSTDQVFYDFSPPGVIGVAGDWNGNGISDVGDFNPATGIWHLDLAGTGAPPGANETFQFGQAGDQPVVGNWDGNPDGQDELGVFRANPNVPGAGEFILDIANHRTMDSSNLVFTFGLATDHVIVGDWDGSGTTKVGVYRDAASFIPADAGDIVFSTANVAGNPGSNFTNFVFGLITDKVVIGDWNGSGTSKVGTYRDGSSFNAPGTALFSLDTNGDLAFDAGDQVFLFGLDTDQFVTGHWAPTPPVQPPGTPQAQFAANGPGSGLASPLTEAQLEPVLQQAIAAWAADGANVAQLEAAQVTIGTLDDNLVGETSGNQITIDATADGWGWNTDTSNADFTSAGPYGLQATPGSAAAGEMDLLTVVEHEFGHVLGLPDVNPLTNPSSLMASTLPVGVRRSPTATVDTVFASGPLSLMSV